MDRNTLATLAGLCASLVLPASASAAQAANPVTTDKGQYNILNATPESQMREWHTDRFGTSSYTCDAGHIEADVCLVRYFHDEYTGVSPMGLYNMQVDAWSAAAMQIKAGLLNNVDFGLELTPYSTVTQEYRYTDIMGNTYTGRHTDSGFSDMNARVNWNLWGNDGGNTALSLAGIIRIPTASDGLGWNHVAGGPAVQFDAKLPLGFDLRLNSYFCFLNDYADDLQVDFINLIGVSHRIVGNLNGNLAFKTEVTTSSDDWLGTIIPGLSFRVAKNVELYADVIVGVNGSRVLDYAPGAGIAARF